MRTRKSTVDRGGFTFRGREEGLELLPAVDVARVFLAKCQCSIKTTLLHLIERTVPYRAITVDNNDLVDSTVDLPEEAVEPPPEIIEMAKDYVRQEIDRGKTPEVAVDFVCKLVFGLPSAQFRVALEKEFLG